MKNKISFLYYTSQIPVIFLVFLAIQLMKFLSEFRQYDGNYSIYQFAIPLMFLLGSFILFVGISYIYINKLQVTLAKSSSLNDIEKITVYRSTTKNLSIITSFFAIASIHAPFVVDIIMNFMGSSLTIAYSRSLFNLGASILMSGTAIYLAVNIFRNWLINASADINLFSKVAAANQKKEISFSTLLYVGILQTFFMIIIVPFSSSEFFVQTAILAPDSTSLWIWIALSLTSLLVLVPLVFILVRTLKKMQDLRIMRFTKQMEVFTSSQGGLSTIQVSSFDEFGELYESINTLTEGVIDIAMDFKARCDSLDNSLAILDEIYRGSHTPMSKATRFAEEATESNAQILSLSNSDKNVHNLNTTSRMIEQQLNDQEVLVDRTANSLGQMTTSIANIIQTIQTSVHLIGKLNNFSYGGNAAIEVAKKAIEEIQEAAQSVSEILIVIQRIAGQTNLLSMNASIEAAHAEKSGSGFALVAQSVRTLANASTESTKKIEHHIDEMSEWIQSSILTISSTNKTFHALQKQLKDNSDLINTISNAMNEEEEAARNTMTSVEAIVSSVRSIRDKFHAQKEAAINIEETMSLIIDLSQRMSQLFKLENTKIEDLEIESKNTMVSLDVYKHTLKAISQSVSNYCSIT